MTDDSLPTHLPSAASYSGCGDVYYDQYYLDMFRRALIQCDRYAQEYIQHHFAAVVLDWLRRHPRRALACHLTSEEHYVNQAFEHFWQMSLQHQELEVPSLACALLYLRTSLNSVILDALRSSFRPQESLLLKTASTGDSFADSHSSGQEVWEIVEGKLKAFRCARAAIGLPALSLWPQTRGNSTFLSPGVQRRARNLSPAPQNYEPALQF